MLPANFVVEGLTIVSALFFLGDALRIACNELGNGCGMELFYVVLIQFLPSFCARYISNNLFTKVKKVSEELDAQFEDAPEPEPENIDDPDRNFMILNGSLFVQIIGYFFFELGWVTTLIITMFYQLHITTQSELQIHELKYTVKNLEENMTVLREFTTGVQVHRPEEEDDEQDANASSLGLGIFNFVGLSHLLGFRAVNIDFYKGFVALYIVHQAFVNRRMAKMYGWLWELHCRVAKVKTDLKEYVEAEDDEDVDLEE